MGTTRENQTAKKVNCLHTLKYFFLSLITVLYAPTELGSRVNGITKSTPSTQEKPSKGLKKRLETSISSDISAEEELSEVDRNTCTNSAAEEDVTSNNNRPMNSVVKVRPNPAKRVRQSTSSLQVSNIKVENKTDKVHQPDPIEGLDELRK